MLMAVGNVCERFSQVRQGDADAQTGAAGPLATLWNLMWQESRLTCRLSHQRRDATQYRIAECGADQRTVRSAPAGAGARPSAASLSAEASRMAGYGDSSDGLICKLKVRCKITRSGSWHRTAPPVLGPKNTCHEGRASTPPRKRARRGPRPAARAGRPRPAPPASGILAMAFRQYADSAITRASFIAPGSRPAPAACNVIRLTRGDLRTLSAPGLLGVPRGCATAR